MPTPNTEAFLVGWIAALRHELAAARSVLDEEFSEAPSDFTPPISDTNTYTWGRVGKHNVVVTSLPEGVYGLSSAAEVASRLSSSLPKLRIGLMVGIGAGITAGGEDIRLGDVVVSKPTGTTGGVVQYDSLKAKTENGKRRDERIGHLARPPAVLLTALTKWGSTFEMDESMVPDIMSAVFEKRPRMRKTFGYPGRVRDPLRSGAGVEDDTRRESPEIHLGVIASSHKLVKTAEERDRIVQWLNEEHIHPLCFEMEAAGLMNAFPCLVIRGICDYADENKNDEWQRYAALTAACSAKQLLHHVDATTMQRGMDLAQRLKSVEDSVKQIQHDAAIISKHAVTEEFDAFLNWISPEDYSGCLHDEKRRHQKGTAQWVLDNPKYKSWVRDQEPSATRQLFCHGRQGTDSAVMYVFFNHKQHGVQNYEHVLATLLRQLLYARQASTDVVTGMHEKHTRNNTRPTLEELEEALQATLTSVKGAFVVLDALDECHTNVTRLLFERLVPILEACHVRLLATARQIPAIEAQFAEAQKIHIEASSEDLALYAGEEMKAKLPAHLAYNNRLTERIVQHVVQNCAGIRFLIAQLVMESLVLLDTVADIHRCLEDIPYGEDGLKYLHQKALERIQALPRPSHVNRALEALVWIVYSKRILNDVELEHALAFGPDDTILNRDGIAPADIIVDQCAGLIRMDRKYLGQGHP
ncbi:hypothetical protein PRZ48_012514 [Zasmidium cellare]|uniref:Nephrocystin 3-like N-terminal domain-containing protein n=1 Tax=Zasmidium cellare TaxID=395010 RepID=A0ABR0E530_ZASCE|nr:hypothetical protein PRZ48_012514 [Zasmidium cellare]